MNFVFKKILGPPLVVVGAILFLFEEIVWDGLGRLTAALGRWPAMARLEAAVSRLPPYWAIVLFAIPWLVILPIKLLALWLLASGKIVTGSGLFGAAELFGMGFLARIYVLCRPSLRRLGWFCWVESKVLAVSGWAHRRMERVRLWRITRFLLHAMMTGIRRAWHRGSSFWLARRWRAAQRRAKSALQK